MSFGEITEAAALVVAKAVQDKADLEKLDLNGTVTALCIVSTFFTGFFFKEVIS